MSINKIVEGYNYLCLNGSETGPMKAQVTPNTNFKFISPNNNYIYTDTGGCCLTAYDGFHIVGLIDETETIKNDVNFQCSPNFACSDCGNTDKERFRTIKTQSQDGTEYDLECSVCESLETEESPTLALHRMATKLEKYRDAWCCLKSKLNHDAELGQGHKVKRALFLMEEFEKELKLD